MDRYLFLKATFGLFLSAFLMQAVHAECPGAADNASGGIPLGKDGLPVYGRANPPSIAVTPVGKVVWIQGDLKAVMADGTVRPLTKNSVIYVHDKLVTGPNSQAQIVYTDHTLMTFQQNTEFLISQYSYNPKAKEGSTGTYMMNLVKGGFRTITGLISKNQANEYQINTPVATIGVRGTDYAAFTKDCDTLVNQYKGSPYVKTARGTQDLSDKVKYVAVKGFNTPPQILTFEPIEFKVKLNIDPADAPAYPLPNMRPNMDDMSRGLIRAVATQTPKASNSGEFIIGGPKGSSGSVQSTSNVPGFCIK